MDKLNNFFRKVYSTPALIWSLSASALFIILGLAIMFFPGLIYGLNSKTRYIYGGVMLLYGLYRLSTFFVVYNRIKDE